MTARCPLCSSPVEVRSLGAFGFEAHCSECFDGDLDAPDWAHLRGIGETREQAIGAWLEDAQSYAANDELPRMPIRYRLTMAGAVSSMQRAELKRQRGWTWRMPESLDHWVFGSWGAE
jgi:hypothetical protein